MSGDLSHNSKGVYLAVLNQGNIRAELSYFITDVTHQNKYRLFITYPAHKPIAQNRNMIIQDFLNRPEYDYLMMIDSDIVPPLNILDLVDHQKDVMGAVCFAFMDGAIVPLLLEEIPENERRDSKPYRVKELNGDEGLVQVDAIGSGVIIMKREVVEALKDQQPFCNRYNEQGIKTLGLDLSFCKKAKEAGFEVWAHTDYICSHWVTLDLKELYQALSISNEIKKQQVRIQDEKTITKSYHR